MAGTNSVLIALIALVAIIIDAFPASHLPLMPNTKKKETNPQPSSNLRHQAKSTQPFAKLLTKV